MPRLQEIVDPGHHLHVDVLAQERDQALGRRARRELLEVVVAPDVREVHHPLHHQRVEPVFPLRVRERAERGGLHLEAERFAHVLRKEAPVRLVLDHLVAAAHRCDVHLEG